MEVIDNLSEGELDKVNIALRDKQEEEELFEQTHNEDFEGINSKAGDEEVEDFIDEDEIQKVLSEEKDTVEDKMITVDTEDYGILSNHYATIDQISRSTNITFG